MINLDLVCSICKKNDKPMTLVNATLTCVPCLEKLTEDFQKQVTTQVSNVVEKMVSGRDIYD